MSFAGRGFGEMFSNMEGYRLFYMKNKELFLRNEERNYIPDVIKKYNEQINELNKYTTKGEIQQLKDFYKNKIKEAKKREIWLYNQLTGADMSENETYPAIIKKWTDLLQKMNTKTSTSEINDDAWLRIIFSSAEFTKEMRDTKHYSAFFRSGLLKNGESKDDVMRRLVKSYMTEKDKMLRELRNIIVATLKEKIPAFGQVKLSRFNYGKRLPEIKETEAQALQEASRIFEKIIKPALKDYGEAYLKHCGVNFIEHGLKNFLTSLDLRARTNSKSIFSGLEEKIFMTLNIEETAQGQFNLTKNEMKNANLIEVFYAAAEKVILDIQDNELSIGWKEKIKATPKSPVEIKALLNNHKNKYGNKLDIKRLDFFAGFTGAVGEFLRYLENTQVVGTGDKIDKKKFSDGTEISLGQSFSDAYFLSGEEKIGLNIKHYVSDFNKMGVTLYEKGDDSGVGFSSPYVYRYFDEDIVSLLRFIDYNYELVSKKIGEDIPNLETVYGKAAMANLSRFLRIDSPVVSYSNYLFVINNKYIPTSYIYYLVYEMLEKSTDNIIKNFFYIQLRHRSPDEYGPRQIKQPDNIISKSKISKSSNLESSKIYFKGLKVKLPI